MAIYITGDTHGGIDAKKLHTKNFPESRFLTKQDYLIITGDFGIWKDSKSQDFLKWIDKNKKFTVLFVEGNHEDYTYLKTFPLVNMFGSTVRKINDSIFQLLRGEIYTIENKTFFTFGGASSIDRFSACRQEGIDWFQEEECSFLEERTALNNLEKHNYSVDYVITHTCASSTLDELGLLYGFFVEGYDNQNKFLEEIKHSLKYTGWIFGHFHKDLIINEKEVVLYNKIFNLNQLFINN